MLRVFGFFSAIEIIKNIRNVYSDKLENLNFGVRSPFVVLLILVVDGKIRHFIVSCCKTYRICKKFELKVKCISII